MDSANIRMCVCAGPLHESIHLKKDVYARLVLGVYTLLEP